MADMWMDVDVAVTIPVNLVPLVDATDGKTIEEAIAYNETGMDLNWNFVTPAGTITQTNVVPTTAGDYDWTHVGNGMYKIEMTASGGASANNDTEGFGWFSGVTDSCLPFRGPVVGFRAARLNDLLIEAGDGEPGQGAPPVTADLAQKIGYLYKFLRNKVDNDGTTIQVYDDAATTVDQKSAVSESGGTVTRGEYASGP